MISQHSIKQLVFVMETLLSIFCDVGIHFKYLFYDILFYRGARWRVLKALRYKPAGRGFDSHWCRNFPLT